MQPTGKGLRAGVLDVGDEARVVAVVVVVVGNVGQRLRRNGVKGGKLRGEGLPERLFWLIPLQLIWEKAWLFYCIHRYIK